MKATLLVRQIGKFIFIGCLIFASSFSPARGADQINSQNFLLQLQNLGAMSEQERTILLKNNEQNLRQISEILMQKLISGNVNNDEKYYAAYFLGKYRFSQAADSLAQNISLEDPVHYRMQQSGILYLTQYPAATALIDIGSPSIPAVIRNLSDSDDIKVGDLSLRVLCGIDRDKDIVQLRLQKALNAEKDPQKQARLQSALKSLAEMSFRN